MIDEILFPKYAGAADEIGGCSDAGGIIWGERGVRGEGEEPCEGRWRGERCSGSSGVGVLGREVSLCVLVR